MTAVVWALTAAVLYGTGAALQQRQAAATPSQAAGRPRLLLLLVRRPWWLLGIGVELGGFATHAVALRTGPLTMVQMLVASSLLFSVATVRLWSGRRLGWTAWAAVLAVIAGIASFVALAAPAGGDASVPVSGHAGLAAACLATCAVPLAAAGLAAAGSRRAVLLAVAAGLADAGIAVVTMAFSHVVSGGLTGMAGSWATYALMLGGPCSLLLTQTAYQAGRPMITLPVIAVITPVASLAAGDLLLGESAQLGVLSGAVAALAVLVTSAGLVVLARLTTEQPGPVSGQGSSVILPAFPAPGSRSGPPVAYLGGGTAIAVHLEHRTSRDLDFFFHHRSVDLDELVMRLSAAGPFAVTERAPGTLNGVFSATRVQFLHANEVRSQRLLEPPQQFDGLQVAQISDLMAMKLKVVGDRGELRDYFDLMTIEQRTGRTADEGLALFLARFQPEFPDQALNHIVLGLGYFDDVDPDDALPVSRQQIVDYWTRRQPEIIAARGR